MNETFDEGREDRLVELTADVVAAYVSNNVVQTSDLPSLIAEVHSALGSTSVTEEVKSDSSQKPAVPVSKSVHHDYIICLENGLKFKSLKRHLMTYHGLTPEAYRAKWNLPANYPMVAPAYAEKRSKLAKEMKLGHKRRG
ncbi:MAG: MucR family transcriptional regulator [Pseudomonadota bacterium]